MLEELGHKEEIDYECYPTLVSIITKLGAVYILVKKAPAKYFWYNVEYLRYNGEDSPVSTKYFTWKEAVSHMREVGAVIYMYNTMDDVAHVCHWAEVQHI